jgi:putative transcriptional regulator
MTSSSNELRSLLVYRRARTPKRASFRRRGFGDPSSVDELTSLRGQLLVATPALLDPNFARTVVLVAEHGEAGAMGLVLNRPSETLVADAVPELASLTGDEEPLYVGGPVATDAVLALAEVDDPDDASELVVGDVGFVQDPDVAARRGRVFVGYAGWSAGQIEAELVEQSWIVVPAEPDDVFSHEPDELWSRVLRRQGGSLALLATMPLDPSLN